MGKTYDGCDWIAAHSFIQRGRSGVARRFSKTRELRYVGKSDADGNCDIALRLHNTDVVTYHLDGSQTIYFGGWNTQTTRGDINKHSVAHVYSLTPKMQKIWDGCSLGVYHRDDPLSAPRIQKCRECHGAQILRHWCSGRGHELYWGPVRDAMTKAQEALPGYEWHTIREPHEWEQSYLKDGKTLYRDEFTEDGMVRVTHQRERFRHSFVPCYHDRLEPHTWEAPCERCDGEGRVDFGSQPVPWGFDSDDHITVDATGRVITEEITIAAARRSMIALRRRMRRRAS